MMQNICKKFLLLLMFSLLRVDMLSMDLTENYLFQKEKEKKGGRENLIKNKNLNINSLILEEDSNIPSDDENKYNENFENDRLNPDKTSSNIPFGNDPEEKVINFIKNKVKQEEIKKNNKKTLDVLDILKDVNDHFEEKNKDKEEAIIKNQLTSIDIGKTFEKNIINKNDAVNTIHEVNSILNKRIEKNQELKTLRENQRKKDVNGAINSYYELRQAQSETESEIEKEGKKIEEEKEENNKKIGKIKENENLEAVEILQKNIRQYCLKMKIQQDEKLLKEKGDLLEEKKNEEKEKLYEKLTNLGKEYEAMITQGKDKDELKKKMGEIKSIKKMFSPEELQEYQSAELNQIKDNLEKNKQKFNENKKNLKMSGDFKNNCKKREKELKEIEEREKERGEKLANLNMKKEKVINGLKEVEERIMALSPSSEELDLAIENIKKREDAEEEKKKKEVLGQLKEKNPANIQPYVKMMQEIEEERKMKAKFLEDLKIEVNEKQKNYNNGRVFQKFEDNMKVLDKYLKSNTGIERYAEEIIKVDIKDQNKISKTQNKESKDQNKISEEKTDGFGEYIASSTKNMKRMVEENTIINKRGKDAIINFLDHIEQFYKNIDETQNRDPNIKENRKKEIILLCGKIEEFWKKYNNKRKCTRPEENIEEEEEEEEWRVLKGQQHRKDKFLAKLHSFENFVENYAFGITPIEQLEAIDKEKEEKAQGKGSKDILNKKEKGKNELIDNNNINNEKNKKEKKGKGEEIISTKGNDKEIKNENNNNEELKVTDDGNGKSKIENNNIEKEVINNQKRSTEEIISKGKLFDKKEKCLLLNSKNWHFDKNGKIVKGEDEKEIINNEQNDSDKNDDKSLINLIESQEYKDMRNRALGKDEGKEEQKDGKNVNDINLKIDNKKVEKKLIDDKNIIKKDVVEKQQNNAENILKEGLQLDMIAQMKEDREISEEVFCSYEKCLKKHYPNLFKKNCNYIKTVNNVVENEKERYEKFINTCKGEISKISPLILLRGFGRFAISFLFSTINSIMQFERKDVIGPYFSFYTLSFGRIVQPSFLRENIYIDISLSLLSLLIFSAVDSKIDGYYLSHYKITSPLCRFLSLIKYTTNAFNININFFVNKDFYMSFNIMSIFDSILSWYWFNKSKFEEKIKKEIEEYNTQRKSIKEERKVKRDILVAMLNKQKEAWEKHHVKDFFRRIVAKNLFEGRKNIKEENKEENNIDNKIEEEINTKDDKSIDKSIDDNINQL